MSRDFLVVLYLACPTTTSEKINIYFILKHFIANYGKIICSLSIFSHFLGVLHYFFLQLS